MLVSALLIVVTWEPKYVFYLGCNGGRNGDYMWMIHKCLMLIATLEDHDSLIEKRLEEFDSSNVFRLKFVVYLGRL